MPSRRTPGRAAAGIVKGCDWIVRERQSTKAQVPDGAANAGYQQHGERISFPAPSHPVTIIARF